MLQESDQQSEQQQARAILKDRGSRFLDYLAAVAQTFATRTPRRLENSEAFILSSQIPDRSNLVSVGPLGTDRTWLSMRQPSKPKPVDVPPTLEPYINRLTIVRSTQTPKLNQRFDELEAACELGTPHPSADAFKARAETKHVREAFATWRETVWAQWKTSVKPLEAALDLYQKLFNMYLRLDKDADYVELLFGHCILTWSGRHAVDYPLVLTGAHMIFKESTGTILVEATGPSRMSVAPFEGADLLGYNLLARYQDTFNDHPADVWDETESNELRRVIVSQLGTAARINDTLDIKPGNEPVLQRGWCLLMRKRVDNTSAFYEGLSRKLQTSDYLPEAFSSMFSDVSTVRAAVGDKHDDEHADRLLMPLPANDEQRRIVRQLDRNSGVTVQGPPGTGKSHTIVNLISHLLAQGKRVLVTAEKAQALAVLHNKMPKEIQDLAVAPIGDSVADAEMLRLSVQRMQDSLTDLDVDDARRRLDELNRTIDAADGRLAELNRGLAQCLERQMDEFETTEGSLTAARVAQWVTANAAHNVVPDHVPSSASVPLPWNEYSEYVALASRIRDDDARESSLNLPNPSVLPTGAELASLHAKLERIRTSVEHLAHSGLDMHAIDASPVEHVESVVEIVRPLLAELTALDGPWERELGATLRDSPEHREWLRSSLALLQDQLDSCMQLSGRLLGHTVSVPDGNPKDQLDLLEQWTQRARQGKRLPRFLNKELREFGESVTVDGYTPQTADELQLVAAYIQSRQRQSALPVLVQQTFAGLPIPVPEFNGSYLMALASLTKRTSAINAWWHERYAPAQRLLRPYFPFGDPVADLDALRHAVEALESSVARRSEQELAQRLDDVQRLLDGHAGAGESHLWRSLNECLHAKDYEGWQRALDEAVRLAGVARDAARLQTLHDRLGAVAPQWADAIMASHGKQAVCESEQDYTLAWRLAQACAWLAEISRETETGPWIDESRTVSETRRKATVAAVSLASRMYLKLTRNPDDRTALNIWLDAMKRYGKGTGKNAGNYLTTARRAIPQAMNAMPVWIMPLHKVMDNFDPAVSQLFDVIIVDESSQCDLLSVGVLALARKAVIVGDDKQTSPSNAFKSVDKMVKLQEQYIPDFLGKSLLTFDESLYSLSNRVFQSQIMLREHFRCVPEIIDYSNRFYDSQIFPLRERDHPEIGSPLRAVRVANAHVQKFGKDTVNFSEAQAIAEQIRACCADAHYDGMTFGVVTLMSSEAHQKIVSDRIIEAIGAEEYAKRRLRVGNPPAFQGDERDVIFLSFVTDAAGGHAYAATRISDAQWMNVAASRAKNQLWAFYSMDPAALNANDLRRGLIEYIRDYAVEEPDSSPMATAHTDFERDVIENLTAHGYRDELRAQYRVGRYAIDCVVDLGQGQRLAIECDGDESKTAEQFSMDIAKQRVLERLGWHFVRLAALDYYLDPESAMAPVYSHLTELTRMRDALAADASEPDVSRQDKGDEGGRGASGTDDPDESTDRAEPEPSLADSTPATDESISDTHHARHARHAKGIADYEMEAEYSLLEYGNLLNESDIPKQSDGESDVAWLQSTVLMLVANEFPLSVDLLNRQVIPLMREKGYSASYARRRVAGALEYLVTKRHIACVVGYCYPMPVDVPFRIIRGRGVKDISAEEVAFVIRQLSFFPEGKRRSVIETQLDRIYEWSGRDMGNSALVDQAFQVIVDSGLATIEHDVVVPTQHSLLMGTQTASVWQSMMVAASENEQAQTVTESIPEHSADVDGGEAESEDVQDIQDTGDPDLGDRRRTITTYGERYHLRYAEPVAVKDLPLRRDYDSVEDWLTDVIIKLVYMQFPICRAMLSRQLAAVLRRAGIRQGVLDGLLTVCLKQCGERIRQGKDGFYSPPKGKGFPFRIIRHREIEFISTQELSFVMQCILRDRPDGGKAWLFEETRAVYGFRGIGSKIRDAFESAYRRLPASQTDAGE
ncbi:AAA domain-containing protein [Bifidobacterium vespertilionis]|uniref:DUF559 domain-containing protein n=1 Tax=Bifidobacterium vespertilionis TaxID=2562524 RepID=A0A5J5E326_9BIFI|nr:AAA domain-containing protein [Bifidobacterium vespertilionis]KAA8822006.1 hypothetical protein EMO90_02030 [Bifidobacterium vespertilionis]KAA8823553.1 hypothetical protein EM848_05255 [Bifidobacterium vespertilionis]